MSEIIGTEFEDGLYGSADDDQIYGLGGSDWLFGGPNHGEPSGNDYIDGGDGGDWIFAGDGNDTVLGGDGAYDQLYGGDGDDTLSLGAGGTGFMDGGAGNDTFLFGAGDGTNNQAYSTAGDRLVLTNLTPAEVTFTRNARGFTATVVATGASLYVDAASPIDGEEAWRTVAVEFADGTVWGAVELAAAPYSDIYEFNYLNGSEFADNLYGLGGNDQLWGLDGNDTLHGGEGQDQLSGGVGDDVLLGEDGAGDNLQGGDGNDTLSGGAGGNALMDGGVGNDTFLFTADDGANNTAWTTPGDRVVLQGLNPGDVSFTRGGSDFTATVVATGASLRVSGVDAWRTVAVEFGDGTVWGAAELAAVPYLGTEGDDFLYGSEYNDAIYGLGGNDQLYGNDGNDTLDGGADEDLLYGGQGSDTYVLGSGDGYDTLQESADAGETDRIDFGSGIDVNDLWVSRWGDTLRVYMWDTGANLDINSWFAFTPGRIEEFRFQDGTVLTAQTMEEMVNDAPVVVNPMADQRTVEGQNFVYTVPADAFADYDPYDTLQFSANLPNGEQLPNWLNFDAQTRTFSGTVPLGSAPYGAILPIEVRATDHMGAWVTDTFDLRIYSDGTVLGTEGDDFLQGTAADNHLIGFGGNDVLSGNGGTDILEGGAGDDTYTYNSALPIIRDVADASGGNTLSAGSVMSADVTLSVSADGMLQLLWAGGEIRLGSFDRNDVFGTRAVQTYVFGDGTLSYEQLLARGFDIHDFVGTNINDRVYGTAQNDTMSGGDGDDVLFGYGSQFDVDTLHGGNGNDTLIGGAGADSLLGGAGSDTYHVDRASGQEWILELVEWQDDLGDIDRMVFGADITPEDLVVYLDGLGRFTVDIAGSTTSILFNAWFNTDISTRVERFEFQDGTVLTDATLTAMLNDAPAVANPIADQSAQDQTAFAFTVPADTFADADPYDSLTYSATLADGSALPAWLSFDAQTRTFSGTPQANDAAMLQVRVTATDEGGLTASDDFTLDVQYDGVIDGTEGEDTLFGTAGNDTIYALGGNDQLWGYEGSDFLDGGAGNDSIVAGLGDDYVFGGDGDDYLLGGDGNDSLFGGTGADQLIGGEGDDVYTSVEAADVVVENADGGYDVVLSLEDYTLAANVEQLWMNGSQVFGGGNDLDNAIQGNDANNIIDGGAGADSMQGGLGDDTYYVDQAGDTILELPGGGYDTVYSSATAYSLGVLSSSERIVLLSGAVSATGNSLANDLVGNALANTLDGGAGADTLQGGGGADVYYVDNAGDMVVEAADEGFDTVWSTVSYTLGANVDELRLMGGEAIDGTGNELGNGLIGNSAANLLTGGLGSDYLSGGLGVDTMIGGQGNEWYVVQDSGDIIVEASGEGYDRVQALVSYALADNLEELWLQGTLLTGDGNALNNLIVSSDGDNVLRGGAGNDTYNVTDGDVVIENAGEGTDTVESSVTFTLGSHVENLTLTGTAHIDGSGNLGDNVIIGNAANNSLTGGGGNDTLVGGAGNDQYNLHYPGTILVVEGAGGGFDTVYAFRDYTLTANVERLFIFEGTGTGNELNNEIYGNNGDNTLDGAGGMDLLAGYGGNDTYFVDNIGDTIIEDGGYDTVKSSISYALGAEFEELWLIGTGTINGSGNDGNNSLYGNSAANELFGGLGNDYLSGGFGVDTMHGGLGDDLYDVADTGDLIVEAAGEGVDTVLATTNYTLAANVENMTLTFSGLTGTGNGLDNRILGTDGGGHTLIGGGGDDTLQAFGTAASTLIGGTGNDTYEVDQAGDSVVESAGEGVDTVRSWASVTLGANVENLNLLGLENLNGTGNSAANVLTGNSGANILDGGTGADSMAGGAGDDTYVVDNAGDSVSEAAGGGTDTVQSSITYTLGAEVENLTLTGGAAISATGNALDNVLTGNSGNNTLAGGAGNDTYFIQGTGDTVSEGAGAGTDVVNASFTYTLGANVEGLILGGTANVNGTGNTLANLVRGNAGTNTLNGGAGFDALEGGGGTDTLTDTSGGNYFHGGAGNDTITGGSARDFFIGGTGNDTINTGNGAEVIAFNVGDGQDIVNASSGLDDTLSLGGAGVSYASLTFQRVNKDLMLNVSATDKVTLKNWYQGTNNRNILTLQVVGEASAAFDVEAFDFVGLVGAFDAARAANPGLTTWALSNALAQEHLWSSDDGALGGDLAYFYGLNGNLTGLDFQAAQNIMTSPNYGTQPQLHLIGEPFGGAMRLS